MLRVRHHAAASFHNYFNRTGYIQIHTPILTSNDCEGGGEVTTISNEHISQLPSLLLFQLSDFYGKAE